MLGYDFDLKYLPDRANKVADALSHIRPYVELNVISASHIVGNDIIHEEVEVDEELGKKMAALAEVPQVVTNTSYIRVIYCTRDAWYYLKNSSSYLQSYTPITI